MLSRLFCRGKNERKSGIAATRYGLILALGILPFGRSEKPHFERELSVDFTIITLQFAKSRLKALLRRCIECRFGHATVPERDLRCLERHRSACVMSIARA